MMDNYDIELTPQYLNMCTYQYKCGMYPTFDMISEWCNINHIADIIPTTAQSEIINKLSEFVPMPIITNYFLEVLGYRNVLLPLSKRYPDLQTITNRLRYMWLTHDIINRNKFMRLIDILTDANNISPLYNKRTKWTSDETTTPNLTDTTNTTKSTDTDSTDTITKNLSDSKTGTDTTKNTGTVTTDEDVDTTKTETHSGGDSTDTTSNNTTVNGVTSDDQTTTFNDDRKEVQNGSVGESTTYGEHINNVDSTTTTNTRTDNTTEQTTYNTTNRHTGTDTHVIDGTESTTGQSIVKKTGTTATDAAGERFESDMSLNDMLDRENVITTILDRYFASVAHELALYTLEKIW